MRKHTVAAAFLATTLGALAHAQTAGPLRVHTENGRYFADSTGQAILLTGSHTWPNLQDSCPHTPGHPFDYGAWLDMLMSQGHNFQRLWAQDNLMFGVGGQVNILRPPHQWLRTGPGLARDGLPRFDLTRHDPAFFARLRARVIEAGQRGIYCGVMLFEGWGLHRDVSHWAWHPMAAGNNVNGLNGDVNNDGAGYEIQTVGNTAAPYQDAFVRAVIDTVADLDNVLYEITNEGRPGSANRDWQYRMIQVIRDYEIAMNYVKHPVGMTVQWPVEGGATSNAALFASSADWISPGQASGADYQSNPPAATGAKVILPDTDHINSTSSHGHTWVWKNFLRGANPILMDFYDRHWLSTGQVEPSVRAAMGHCRAYSLRVDLAGMVPQGSIASSGYALVGSAAGEVISWVGAGHHKRKANLTINLSALPGVFSVEWFNPGSAAVVLGANVNGGASRTFTVPWTGSAGVLFLKRV